jgi:hypothetical protein
MKEKGMESEPDEIQLNRSSVTGFPSNWKKIVADTIKEASTINEAIAPETDLGKTLLPREVIKKPTSGKMGMSHANLIMRCILCYFLKMTVILRIAHLRQFEGAKV